MNIFIFFLHIFCYDLWFYAIHRLLHMPKIYSKYHYQHHAYVHPSWKNALTAHWIENFFSGIGVLFPLLYSVNAVSFIGAWIFCFVRGIARHDKRMPLSSHHLYHHKNPACNYSSIYLDFIFGTLKSSE